MNSDDSRHMRQALAEAEKAGQRGEVPVGAVLVAQDGTVLAAAGNRTIELADPSAHAEMLVLRAAGQRLGNYRLPGTTLYVTVEPCIMCMGAAVHARIARVVFGAPDPKWGAAGSMYNVCTDSRLNHCIETTAGVLAEECRELIQAFFRARR
jgi:tRNA(adenine34) deaminase